MKDTITIRFNKWRALALAITVILWVTCIGLLSAIPTNKYTGLTLGAVLCGVGAGTAYGAFLNIKTRNDS